MPLKRQPVHPIGATSDRRIADVVADQEEGTVRIAHGATIGRKHGALRFGKLAAGAVGRGMPGGALAGSPLMV